MIDPFFYKNFFRLFFVFGKNDNWVFFILLYCYMMTIRLFNLIYPLGNFVLTRLSDCIWLIKEVLKWFELFFCIAIIYMYIISQTRVKNSNFVNNLYHSVVNQFFFKWHNLNDIIKQLLLAVDVVGVER